MLAAQLKAALNYPPSLSCGVQLRFGQIPFLIEDTGPYALKVRVEGRLLAASSCSRVNSEQPEITNSIMGTSVQMTFLMSGLSSPLRRLHQWQHSKGNNTSPRTV